MRHIPSYLLPKGKLAVTTGDNKVGYVPFKVDKRKRGGWKAKMKAKSSGVSKRKSDPLKSFKSSSA
jgi:ATP-dependent RNA helicase DDX56/DBP9